MNSRTFMAGTAISNDSSPAVRWGREIVGGCCVTEEIAPGCRASTTFFRRLACMKSEPAACTAGVILNWRLDNAGPPIVVRAAVRRGSAGLPVWLLAGRIA